MPLTDFRDGLRWTNINWSATGNCNPALPDKLVAMRFWIEDVSQTPDPDDGMDRIRRVEGRFLQAQEFDFSSYRRLISYLSRSFAIQKIKHQNTLTSIKPALQTATSSNTLCMFSINYKRSALSIQYRDICSVKYYVGFNNRKDLIIFSPSLGEVKIKLDLLSHHFDQIFESDVGTICRTSIISVLTLKSAVAGTAQARPKSPTPPPAAPQGAVGGSAWPDDLTGLEPSRWEEFDPSDYLDIGHLNPGDDFTGN